MNRKHIEGMSPRNFFRLLFSFIFSGRQRHRNRRTSDNESELSRGSGRSQHRKHRRHRSRHRRNESGSDNDGNRARSFSGHRKSTGSMELLDSNNQWNDAQRHQNESYGAMQSASSMKSNLSGSKHHSNDTDSHHSSSHRSRRHRKNRFVIERCLDSVRSNQNS